MNQGPIAGSFAAAVLMPCAQADEVICATRLWLERAVIGLNLCPFAKAVHRKEQIRYAVTAAETPDDLLAELERELGLLASCDPVLIDTTLLIHPNAMSNFIDFHFFLSEANVVVRRLSGLLALLSAVACGDTAAEESLEARLVRVEARYSAQFTALDAAMSSMNTTSAYLTQQLANL